MSNPFLFTASRTLTTSLSSSFKITTNINIVRRYAATSNLAYYYRAKENARLTCEIEEYTEPLYQYRKGGYHPTHLGDPLKGGRYKVIDKLGWGDDATVWLAKDRLLCRNVAVKIMISELSLHNNNEVHIIDRLSQGQASHPGKRHIVQLLDQFEHEGPNGIHPCLVLELLGPNAEMKAEAYESRRLPGAIAREASRQVVQALEYIHDNDVAHGDLSPRNIVFADIAAQHQSERDLVTAIGQPKGAAVNSFDGYPHTRNIPNYLIAPTSLPLQELDAENCMVKVIDFGEACLGNRQGKMHCHLGFQAPEAVLTNQWDSRVDIWSLGCTIFELLAGYPLFDNKPWTGNSPSERARAILDWEVTVGDLPEEWKKHVPQVAPNEVPDRFLPIPLIDWLRETYFCKYSAAQEYHMDDTDDYIVFGNRNEEYTFKYGTAFKQGYADFAKADFSKGEIDAVGELLQLITQYRPRDRPSVTEILSHPWFDSRTSRRS